MTGSPQFRDLNFNRLKALSNGRRKADMCLILAALGLGLFHSALGIWFLIDCLQVTP